MLNYGRLCVDIHVFSLHNNVLGRADFLELSQYLSSLRGRKVLDLESESIEETSSLPMFGVVLKHPLHALGDILRGVVLVELETADGIGESHRHVDDLRLCPLCHGLGDVCEHLAMCEQPELTCVVRDNVIRRQFQQLRVEAVCVWAIQGDSREKFDEEIVVAVRVVTDPLQNTRGSKTRHTIAVLVVLREMRNIKCSIVRPNTFSLLCCKKLASEFTKLCKGTR
mmetsp:Transcript_30416/g.62714  ORF Transcript_30416/g.62714 Transcript_30416/m.62714 type:complete len:225 (-) Transcript_30416:1739-2413(-)